MRGKNDVPSVFLTLCRIGEMSRQEIDDSWSKITDKTFLEFSRWLIDETKLSDSQAVGLQKLVEAPQGEEQKALGQLVQTFSPDQKQQASAKLLSSLVANLQEFYNTLYQGKTMEQKQVIDAFLKSKEEN
ncbi:MAG: hypothetical protein UX31_C0028G0001 [Candidatus Nomurabacteria bacterium GW2011_GWA1_46_11]|uniref:Uncharacterized protein n=1 Tax=Candidatus Nomurabacteria bacterium GW2011_GWA1_46_11 TaxID=1618732 RepID=A0A0G1NJM9_9BACT|nr:MAG: hypothetical protein UX31_C0028G0001 [Candidatus Nomurabacteria bacterium GW2011_GWA1_46_11]